MSELAKAAASSIPKPQDIAPLITAKQLLQIESKIGVSHAEQLAPIISDVCIKYGITTRLRLAAFLSNIIEESGGFVSKEENLYYTTAARIRQVWPSRFPTLASAQPYVKNPNALASSVYANRLGNGSLLTGDGYKYRGLGYIQITGKTMHEAYQKYAGVSEEEMRTSEFCAVDSAAWYCVVYNKKFIPLADKGLVAFGQLVISINGALTNYAIRVKYYERCLKILS